MNIFDHLRSPQGKPLEFKRGLSSPLTILKTLEPFANGAGRTLIVGVEDKTRNVVGVPDALNQEERLANWIAEGIHHTASRQPLPCLLEAAMDFARKHARRGMALVGARRMDRCSAPMGDMLHFMRSQPVGSATAEVAQHLNVTVRAARSRMRSFHSRAAVDVVGRNECDPKHRHFLADEEAHAVH